MNGASSVASPWSKPSTLPSYLQSSGSSYSSINPLEYALYKMHAFVLGSFSHRASRPPERSRPKRQSQTLFLDMIPSVANYSGKDFGIGTTASVVKTGPENVMPLSERQNTENDSLGELYEGKSKPTLEIHEERVVTGAELPKEEPILEILKPLITVSPTFSRWMQAYCLNRLAQTLKLVGPPLLWIIAEMTSQSSETADILRRAGVMYRHLFCNKNVTGMRDREVHLRNVAPAHIETHPLDGIIYFADDTNLYSVDLFNHSRQIRICI